VNWASSGVPSLGSKQDSSDSDLEQALLAVLVKDPNSTLQLTGNQKRRLELLDKVSLPPRRRFDRIPNTSPLTPPINQAIQAIPLSPLLRPASTLPHHGRPATRPQMSVDNLPSFGGLGSVRIGGGFLI